MFRFLVAVMLCMTASSLAPSAHADDTLPARAVQSRLNTERHELTLSTGLLPMDAFEKGLTVGGSYTWHFSDLLAWEAVNYQHSFPLETALRDELRLFDLEPTPFERVERFVTSNLVFKPVYFKGAWLNDGLAFGEFFALAGGGYGWLTRSSRAVVDVGVGVRFYTGDHLSVRFDLRELLFVTRDDIHDELWLGLGISL